MTDEHQMAEERAAHAAPDEASRSPPGAAAALVPVNISRERYATLIETIGLRSPMAQLILDRLSDLHGDARDPNPWFSLWREHCSQYFDLDAAEGILAGDVQSAPGTRLFLAQSYGKIVLTEFAGLAAGRCCAGSGASLYGWIDHFGNEELAALRHDLRHSIIESADPARLDASDCSDLLAAMYQEIFPPALRHLLGEYYTPSWLVRYCIDQARRRHGDIAGRITILDPAAGSGGFLAHSIAHIAAGGITASATIIGFDINPLAVDFCRANAQLASKAREHSAAASFDIQIRLADAIADPAPVPVGQCACESQSMRKTILGTDFLRKRLGDAELESGLDRTVRPFHLPAPAHKAFAWTLRQYVSDTFAASRRVNADIIVGNPPWIAWDGLTRRYRDSLAPQWAMSKLMVSTGWRAKVAAGKTDISSLFVYRAAERHAAANAVMAFVLPLSLFQSHLAGAGFRTFRTAGGRPFALVELDDFSAVKVFPDAVNRTSVGTFAVDKSQQFPIRYASWSAASNDSRAHLTSICSPGGPLVAADLTAPIVAFEPGRTQFEMAAGRSDYRARGGVNTGGANPILWLTVLAQTDSTVTVRNIGKSRRSESPVAVAEVERDAVYPLLCGADMRRWNAAPSRSILLLYSPDRPKKALSLEYVQDRLPNAYAFVSRFREQLESRKEYHRWGGSRPFYEVYRIGPYTFSPVKVAWQHTGYRKALNVSVVDDRGRRPAIPDQKVILIPFDDVDEAHYVCAFLSSSVTAALLDRYLGVDASTHILDYVALRKFVPDDDEHRRLAALSVAAHQAAAAGAGVAHFEREIDAIVARLQRV